MMAGNVQVQDSREAVSNGRAADKRGQEDILHSIRAFLAWLDRHGLESYDPYDLWATLYGIFSRRLYYKRRGLGAALAAPMTLLDQFAPRLGRQGVPKRRYPSAEAQLVLGYLNLFEATKAPADLDAAVNLGRELLRFSIPGYSGHCWGYPFDWQNNRGLWKQGTPFITATPYCFEAFLGLYDVLQDQRDLDVAQSVAQFALRDLRETSTSAWAACSYSPDDHSMVINANGYRAYVLIESWKRFGNEAFKDAALRNLRFICDQQRPDGSWLYAAGNPQDAFIDNIHTCFTLKNLFKLNRVLQSGEVRDAIRRGYAYYRTALFDRHGHPRPFAVSERWQFVRRDLYDYAEGISLGVLLKDEIPGAYELAKQLAAEVLERFQLPSGQFVTRVNVVGGRATVPYLRWAQAPMFYALTNLLRSLVA